MLWETLPVWFWIIYYLVLVAILATAIYSVVKRKHTRMSVIAIILTVTIPSVSLIQSIGRAEGMNEFEHLISQLQQGAVWSLFTVGGYLFLVVWLIFFLFKRKDEKRGIDLD
ncbi:hypothetical protein A6P54_17985 [Bacillus sp. MKU004]|nr:hypothetical protein A6P54_17985 [Bacillus sp. MKU004]